MRSHYRLGERLGVGGMGDVFRAMRICAEGIERTVAIKRIHLAFAQQDRFVQRFIREAQVLCRMTHPSIVSVLGFERDASDQVSLVMEYVDGDSGALPRHKVPLRGPGSW